MEICYKCRTPETHAVLFDVVLPGKVDKICANCAYNEEYPVFKDAAFSDKKEKYPSVHERLMRMTGLAEQRKQRGFDLPQKKESNLREIIKAAASKPVVENVELKKDLIDNFHWLVMRARRNKHLTKEQLAKNIGEPLEIIESVEAGNAPTRREVINKIENHLGIRIRKDNSAMYPKERKASDFGNVEILTDSDLKEMK